MCQIFGHGLKLLYFGAMVDQVGTVDPLVAGLAVASAVLGTMLSKRVLEAMTDGTYRRWAGYIITVISAFYVLQGGRSEEHTSELQSLMRISYAVFCLKKKK